MNKDEKKQRFSVGISEDHHISLQIIAMLYGRDEGLLSIKDIASRAIDKYIDHLEKDTNLLKECLGPVDHLSEYIEILKSQKKREK